MGFAVTLFAADILDRWARGFSVGAAEGALLGAAFAVLLKLFNTHNWKKGACARARAIARGQGPEETRRPPPSPLHLLRDVTFLLFGVVGLIGGLGLAVLGAQAQAIAAVAHPTPLSLTVAQLLEKGADDNLHVELKQFTFGRPVVEKDGKRWLGVWLVLQPAGRTPRSGHATYTAAVLWTPRIQDQDQLDDLLRQTTVNGLVTTPLKDSSLKVQPTHAFRKANPGLDSSRVAFVTDQMEINVPPNLSISEPALFDAGQASAMWYGGIMLCVLGCVVLLLLLFRG